MSLLSAEQLVYRAAKSLANDLPAMSRVGLKLVMLEKRKISRDAGTDRCIQLANGFFILAEKELLAFITAT